MLEWALCRFYKKRTGTRYAELEFLHPGESVGHIVHFGASRLQNITALFFMLGWTWCSIHKKCVGPRYAELVFLCPVGYAGHVVHSCESGP
jgi:hypothetical protein